MRFTRSVLLGVGLTVTQGLAIANPASQRPVQFDVPPQPLSSALNAFARQSELKMIFYTDVTEGMQAPALHGALTPEDALKTLLGSAELTYEFFDDNTVSIWAPKDVRAKEQGRLGLTRLARNDLASANDGARTEGGPDAASAVRKGSRDEEQNADQGSTKKAIPEILVKGSRVLNSDIMRTRDDSQPYVVFSQDTIRESGATSSEEFLRKFLTSNTSPDPANQLRGGGAVFRPYPSGG